FHVTGVQTCALPISQGRARQVEEGPRDGRRPLRNRARQAQPHRQEEGPVVSRESRRIKREQKAQKELQQMRRLEQLHKKARNKAPKAASSPCPTCHGARKLRVMKGDGKISYRRCGACRGSGSI